LVVIGRNSIVAVEPIRAKLKSNVLRKRPWSAAPDIEMMRRDCNSTLIEKVYMAKLAVLISVPRRNTMHWFALAARDWSCVTLFEVEEAASD